MARHEASVQERITLESSRAPLRARVGDTVVAESAHALILHETGYPDRVYFPRADVRMELLEPSRHRTRCPWKGEAAYWSLNLGSERRDNAAWAYMTPIP
ncbi:MAG TPA: DUF427 domain-containing protein, partial [Kiloniellales bacterium]|nr:DUF427 domain-containing protein [Kiloniellales bacterium]